MNVPANNFSRELILGVGGGIAAYKSCELLRRLQEHGFLVSVIPTRASLNFVGKATWEALSGRAVQDDLWNNVHEVPHIAMAKKAAAIVIAPATADLIARIATGRADDFLTNVIVASTAPLILVPAMHSEMWLNPATVANVETLRSRGVTVIDPASGKLTSGDVGIGRYPESDLIIASVEKVLHHKADAIGRKVLISAGGTREPIDPVRYIGNLSSGKQGIALALNSASRGAITTLVIANAPDVKIDGVEVIHVSTAAQMFAALDSAFDECDVLVMAAAVADARPVTVATEKLPKGAYTEIELVENDDILAALSARRAGQVIIGFAAQTGTDAVEKGSAKLAAKGLDFIYVNDVSNSEIFGKDETQGTIIDSQGKIEHINQISKVTLAEQLLTKAIDKLGYAND